ncbi:hypothetical protein SDC9_155477 [bioreactor metagenome]|uniref:Uncharacterized protein n=1 Tax=bioreactor metagenome TaxID=1076179 RepID=A0A645F3H6_9ZZZZ
MPGLVHHDRPLQRVVGADGVGGELQILDLNRPPVAQLFRSDVPPGDFGIVRHRFDLRGDRSSDLFPGQRIGGIVLVEGPRTDQLRAVDFRYDGVNRLATVFARQRHGLAVEFVLRPDQGRARFHDLLLVGPFFGFRQQFAALGFGTAADRVVSKREDPSPRKNLPGGQLDLRRRRSQIEKGVDLGIGRTARCAGSRRRRADRFGRRREASGQDGGQQTDAGCRDSLGDHVILFPFPFPSAAQTAGF